MLSIVIPTLNEGDRVRSLLDHLVNIPGITEVIVVDASDDEESLRSMQLLSNFELPFRMQLVKADVCSRALQLNQGVMQAGGSAILCLHCDTLLPADTVSLVSQALTERKWGRFDLRLNASGFRFRMIEFMINLRSRLTRLATGDQAMFFDRSFFIAQQGFAPIALMEDIELSKRLGKQWSPALIRTPVITSARRWQQYGTWRTICLMWKLRFLYWIGVQPDRLAEMYQRDKR